MEEWKVELLGRPTAAKKDACLVAQKVGPKDEWTAVSLVALQAGKRAANLVEPTAQCSAVDLAPLMDTSKVAYLGCLKAVLMVAGTAIQLVVLTASSKASSMVAQMAT